jgi:hypothetical protein
MAIEVQRYRNKKELPWFPRSFEQPAQHDGGHVEVVDSGLLMFMPVKMNVNLKTKQCLCPTAFGRGRLICSKASISLLLGTCNHLASASAQP